jgi:hypothetical protein
VNDTERKSRIFDPGDSSVFHGRLAQTREKRLAGFIRLSIGADTEVGGDY